MMATPELTIHTDGAARGNPGPAAFAFVIYRDGEVPLEEAGLLGQATNNVAEYQALIRSLERARTMGAKRLVIKSDSELLVKQMQGLYRVKNAQLHDLYMEAKDLCRHFDRVDIRHVRREENAQADRLCNEVLDGALEQGRGARDKGRGLKAADPRPSPLAPSSVRAELIACLQDAAETWADRGTEQLKPEDVWADLEDILVARGLLRRL
jgi:ribonuclease HI